MARVAAGAGLSNTVQVLEKGTEGSLFLWESLEARRLSPSITRPVGREKIEQAGKDSRVESLTPGLVSGQRSDERHNIGQRRKRIVPTQEAGHLEKGVEVRRPALAKNSQDEMDNLTAFGAQSWGKFPQ